MGKKVVNSNSNLVYDSTTNSITFVNLPTLTINDIHYINTLDNGISDLIFRKDIVGKSGTITTNNNNETILNLEYQISPSPNCYFEALIEHPSLTEELSFKNDNIVLFYEDNNIYTAKYSGLKKVIDTDYFESDGGLYKIEVSACITNKKKHEGCEIYLYLNDNPNNLLFKLYHTTPIGYEYIISSNYKVLTIPNGVNNISVYITTTKNKKTAYMKHFQILITEL